MPAPKGCRCGGRHVQGRACTPMLRKIIIEKLVEQWERFPTERLGQFIVNCAGSESRAFTVEDESLVIDATCRGRP